MQRRATVLAWCSSARAAWPRAGRFTKPGKWLFADAAGGRLQRPPSCAQWQGEAIIVMPEQGLGDEIQFVRYLALLKRKVRRVGLVWKGNPKNLNDAERSLPGLEVLAPLREAAGLCFFSVQKSEVELPRPPELPLTDLAPLIGDFADTVAILS